MTQIGQGGFGIVYKVEDVKSKKIYALKLLKSIYNIKRVSRHVDVLKILNTSPLFLKVYKTKKVAAQVYILMDYVEGENLCKMVRQKAFTKNEALKVITDMLDSLEFLQRHNIIHGDIKAENVLKKDSKYRLIDFDTVQFGELRQTLHILNDDDFTAPEIYKGTQSFASDIYSLGCMLYYLLYGEHIYAIDKKLLFCQKMYAHLFLYPQKNEKLSYLISRMIDKNPDTRATIEELRTIISSKKADTKIAFADNMQRTFSDEFALYRFMAEQNIAYAQNIFGLMYEEGEGVTKDSFTAFEWYEKAAEQGLLKAKFNLGLCYRYAKGCEKDLAKARTLFEEVAEHDHARSFYNLSQLTDDAKQKRYYLEQAALNGYRAAYKEIEANE